MVTRIYCMIFTILALATSSAQAGVLAGSVDASASGTHGSSGGANFGGTTMTSQLPVFAFDDNTGQGAGFGYGDAFGKLVVESHGCVEPSAFMGSTSSAGGSGLIGFSDTYSVQSSTLPLGTPVAIDFSVIAGFAEQNNDSIDDQSQTQTSNDVHAFFSAGPTSLVGDHDFSDSRLFTNSTTGGLFSMSHATNFTLNTQVGQSISIAAQLNSQSAAFVDPGNVGDVQMQATMLWGGVPQIAGISIISLNTGLPLPDTTNVNTTYLQANIPPPLIELGTPEPSSLVLAVLGGLALIWYRRRSR